MAKSATSSSSSNDAGVASSTPVIAASDPRPAVRTRRRFTAAQKRAILAEAERCSEPGDVGALLRKHGLYSSTLSKWRQAAEKEQGLRSAGRPAKFDEKDREIARLTRELERVQARAVRAEAIVDLQKKVFSILETAATVGQS
jgi:transposase-like protein